VFLRGRQVSGRALQLSGPVEHASAVVRGDALSKRGGGKVLKLQVCRRELKLRKQTLQVLQRGQELFAACQDIRFEDGEAGMVAKGLF